MRIVFNGLFLLLHYFIIICLLDDLPTLLFASGKKVLNRNVILRLDLDLLLATEQVLHELAFLHRLRAFGHVYIWCTKSALLHCLFLISLNQIVYMIIAKLLIVLLLFRCRRRLSLILLVAKSDGRLQSVHLRWLLLLLFELVVEMVLVLYAFD